MAMMNVPTDGWNPIDEEGTEARFGDLDKGETVYWEGRIIMKCGPEGAINLDTGDLLGVSVDATVYLVDTCVDWWFE